MKKILILVDNLTTGGAGRVASILANEMVKTQSVHIVVKDGGIRYTIDNDVIYHVLPSWRRGKVINILLRIVHYSRLLNLIKPDYIYSFGYMSKYTTFALLFASKCNAKVISSERSDPFSVPKSIFMKKIRDYCYGKADCLVCQTSQARDYFATRINTNIEVIPNPITPDLPLWHGINSLDIIAACRLDEQKNLPMLIDAFEMFHKKHNEYKLIIYGDGDLKDDLLLKIKRKGLLKYISVPGATSNIHEIFSKSFMFVSSSNHEGMSNSMLEALAIGIPSVCTDCPVGAPSMFIKNRINGMITPVKDAKKFYLAMDYIASNKDLLNSMSKESIKIRKELNPNLICIRWMQIMDKL